MGTKQDQSLVLRPSSSSNTRSWRWRWKRVLRNWKNFNSPL